MLLEIHCICVYIYVHISGNTYAYTMHATIYSPHIFSYMHMFTHIFPYLCIYIHYNFSRNMVKWFQTAVFIIEGFFNSFPYIVIHIVFFSPMTYID